MLVAVALWTRLPDAAPQHAPWTLPLWALVVAFAVTESGVVHVHFRRSSFALTLGDLPVVVALLFAAPSQLAPAWALGAAVVLIAARLPAVRVAFNLAELSLTATLAATLFDAVTQNQVTAGPATWAAAAAAALTAAIVSSLLLALAMLVFGERVTFARLPGMVLTAAGAAATNISLGLAVAVVLAADARATPLLLVPAATVLLAYRAYQREREKTLGLEFLAQAQRTLERAESAESGLAGVLALSVETFRAEMAEVVLLPGTDGGPGRHVAVGPGERIELGSEVPDLLLADIQAALRAEAGPRIIVPSDVGPALAAYLKRNGVRSAMVTGLPGDSRVVGALLVANRYGVGGAFEAHDVRLLGMLGAHAGAALGQDHLEQRVSALRESQEHLYHQAFHDPLTGLANRLLFQDRVEHAMARRTGNVTVIYVDLDDFKPVNDTYGHDAGDELLLATATRLRASLREADTPARLGGDEFAVLLTDVAPKDVRTVTERILGNLAKPCVVGDVALPIKASVGVATSDSGAMTAGELVRNADAAMYVSKHGGKGGYTVAAPEVAEVAA
jgi:diguanylate cyclase (GGDEF)-like protein